MFRLLGFTTGTALTIGALIMALGTPELREGSPGAMADPMVQPLRRAETTEADAVPADPVAEAIVPTEGVTNVELPIDPVSAVAEPAEAVAMVPMSSPTGAPASSVTAPTRNEPPTTALPEPARPTTSAFPEPAEPAESAAPGSDPLWQSVWNPFRSRIAANGFAARLNAITDIDYRVLRLRPGAYQVAFAYTDDSERAAKIAQIETATGLDLPETAP
jgi:hypothetical protein